MFQNETRFPPLGSTHGTCRSHSEAGQLETVTWQRCCGAAWPKRQDLRYESWMNILPTQKALHNVFSEWKLQQIQKHATEKHRNRHIDSSKIQHVKGQLLLFNHANSFGYKKTIPGKHTRTSLKAHSVISILYMDVKKLPPSSQPEKTTEVLF